MDNDTRGWIMAGVSGAACIAGSLVICIDFLVRLFPGKKDFRIQDSNVFLSSSLSLSFGVMLFSSLYNILPSARTSLLLGGFSAQGASFTLIGCFIGGVIGIQALSRVIHHFMPHHVVDCEHTHETEVPEDGGHVNKDAEEEACKDHGGESAPLLSRDDDCEHTRGGRLIMSREGSRKQSSTSKDVKLPINGSSSRPAPLARHMSSFFGGRKISCDENGPCYGYSDPCGKECFKVLSRQDDAPGHPSNYGSNLTTGSQRSQRKSPQPVNPVHDHHKGHNCSIRTSGASAIQSHKPDPGEDDQSLTSTSSDTRYSRSINLEIGGNSHRSSNAHNHHHHQSDSSSPTNIASQQHHHHVPQNAFLSIGLQTSLAIALHKLPEGFITYATNHTNPKLGFTIFMALFIHNITEGFALALPLYLAIGSRKQAVFWSSLLGGASQPLGAGVAALWLNAAKSRDMLPSEAFNGGMYAVTSGIMTSVALQLFSESIGLTHNKSACIAWAVVGMGILGLSNALTA